jgi:radical SAM-linked protein
MSLRIRITFSKAGAMQYVGHLDLHRAWERTFRRAGLPLEYSQGFHPQPHLNLACALPVGFTSQCEILDAWLEQARPIPEIQPAIEAALPPGLEIHSVEPIDLHTPSLQSRVLSAVYVITFLDAVPDLEVRLQHMLSAAHLPRMRRNKSYDLRPLIEAACLFPPDEQVENRLRLQLAARQAATARPEEVLDALGIKFETTRVHREELILSDD